MPIPPTLKYHHSKWRISSPIKRYFNYPFLQNQNLRTSALSLKYHPLFKQIHLRNFFANLTEQIKDKYGTTTRTLREFYGTKLKQVRNKF